MRNPRGNTTLIIMVVVAAAALLFGFLVMRQRINALPASKTSPDTNPAESQTPDQPPQAIADLAGWKTYANDKYSFQLQYPSNLAAGAVSKNSAVGTFQVPVKGFHVGPLVLVVLKDASLKQQAFEYFGSYYQEALHPQSTMPPGEGGLPASACTIEKIANANVSSIRSVSCTGEGGAARYAYISGTAYDVFVDGYSKGYDTVDYGKFTKDNDYANILSTFKFLTIATSTNQQPPASPNPDTTAQPGIQTFSVTADDSSAVPAEISVPAGTIVEITFNVSSANVYYGGLDFRSSVVNSGTVYSGQSKTISFTARQSFVFTPYWPASNVAKNYTIKVTVR